MLPYDAAFHALVTEATKTILPLHAESEQYSALARSERQYLNNLQIIN